MKELICLLILSKAGVFDFSGGLTYVICGVGFMTTLSPIVQYKKESKIKNTTYECGVDTFSDANIKFDIKYFNYAILFLIFDIETIFLYPFAIYCNKLGIFAIVEAFVFISILLIGLYYAINKKLLRWI